MRKLISLGKRCDVAFQLRAHSGDNTSHFFDWLVVPSAGLTEIIRSDFDVFLPDELTFVAKSKMSFVKDVRTGVKFHHQFPLYSGGPAKSFLTDYAAFSRKFAHLAARFRDTLRTSPVCLVRRSATEAEALEIEAAVTDVFPQADVRFLYVNASPETFRTPLGESRFLPEPTRGLGDSIAWAGLLSELGLVERPYRLATHQVLGGAHDDHGMGTDDRHSLESLRQGAEVNPDNPWIAYELALAYLGAKAIPEARDMVDRARTLDPETKEFVALDLRLQLMEGRIGRKAIAQIIEEGASGQDPCFAPLFLEALMALKQSDKARKLVNQMLRRNPTNHRLYFRKAQICEAMNRDVEALLALDKAIELAPHTRHYRDQKLRLTSREAGEAADKIPAVA